MKVLPLRTTALFRWRVEQAETSLAGSRPAGERLLEPSWLASISPVLLALGALALWIYSLPHIDLARITDLGLVSVLPLAFHAAVALLTVSFALLLVRSRPSTPLLLLHTALLILMLYGLTGFIEPAPHFHPTWRHDGVTDYIIRTGKITPSIDIYFNWPGFFILSALVTTIAGFYSVTDFATWAPLFLNLLYLGPLLMILRSATDNKGLAWLGVWLFYMANWIGQDYYSPQGFNYFLYLTLLGILLTWFKAPAQPGTSAGRGGRLGRRLRALLSATEPPAVPSTATQRVVLMLIAVALFAVMVSGHQLTPVAAWVCVTALVIFRRCTARRLPLLMLAMLAAWVGYLSIDYLSGHVGSLIHSVGGLTGVLHSDVSGRLQGSGAHRVIVDVRLAMTPALWALACLGFIKRVRTGHRDVSLMLLALAPFCLLPLQTYGGEMLLRVYLFALPAMAFFAASLVYTPPLSLTRWRPALASALISLALFAGFLFARYGNEKMDYFTVKEVQGVQHLYAVARPGSLFLSATPDLPWMYQGYTTYHYQSLSDLPGWPEVEPTPAGIAVALHDLESRMSDRRYPTSYLVITRSQMADAHLFGELNPSTLALLVKTVRQSRDFRTIFSNGDASIYTLRKPAHEP